VKDDAVRTFRSIAVLAVLLALAPLPRSARAQGVPVLPDPLIDFGNVPYQYSTTRDFRVVNAGDISISVSNISADNQKFVVQQPNFSVAPGDTEWVTVSYSPASIGNDMTTITVPVTIYSIDPFTETHDTLYVTGVGAGVSNAERISVTPDSIGVALGPIGDYETTIQIRNIGGHTLEWDAAESPSASWLEFYPPFGSVPWGGKVDLHVTISSTGVTGSYDAGIQITSNDASNPTVLVPVHLAVGDRAIIEVAPIGFLTMFVGFTYQKVVTVNNTGALGLEVSNIVPSRGEYQLSRTSLSIPGGESDTLTLTIEAAVPGSLDGLLTFYSNDPSDPAYPVAVSATVSNYSPPQIELRPDTVEATAIWPLTDSKPLTILNIGTAALEWIAAPGQWLSASPDFGEVAGNDSATVTLGFDSAGLGTGDHHLDLVFQSNDPANSFRSVATVFHVIGAPVIEVSDTALTYEARLVGLQETKTISITNIGVDPLHITSIGVSNPNFTLGTVPTTVQPAETVGVDVIFAPQVTGAITGSLVIESDAANDDSVVVALEGTGMATFSFIASTSITATVGPSGWTTQNMLVANPSEVTQPVTLVAYEDPGGSVAERAGAAATIPIFFDNFEDLEMNEWTDAGGSGVKEIVGAGPNSPLCYRESDSPGGHRSGVYATLPAVAAREVGFWVRPGQVDKYANYVTLHDGAGNEAIYFFAMGTGVFYVNANVGGDQSYPYEADTWYFVEFRDIDFTAKNFDYYVNGLLVMADVPMRNPSLVNEFSRIDLYSYSVGATASWDDVWILWGTDPAWLGFSPVSSEIDPSEFGLFRLRFNAVGLPPGTYRSTIALRSNQTVLPPVTVPVTLVVDSLLTGVENEPIPSVTALRESHPNPFNPTTTVAYDLHQPGDVSLVVYDVRGARVRTLVSRRQDAGSHTATWDGADEHGRRVASGVYFCRFTAGTVSQTRKLVLVK